MLLLTYVRVMSLLLPKSVWQKCFCVGFSIYHTFRFSQDKFSHFLQGTPKQVISLARAGRAQGRATRAQGGAVRYGDVIDISWLWDLMAMSYSHDGYITGI